MTPGTVSVVWQCPFWRVEECTFTGPDGRERTWYSAARPNPHTVHMLAITPEGLVPVLRQWRAPLDDWVWELPAGVCDREGESLTQAARRELLEETGFLAGRVELLFTGTVSPGFTNELYNAFLCRELTRQSPGGGTGGERLVVHLVPFDALEDHFMQAVRSGELVDAKVLTLLLLARRALEVDGA